MGVLGLCGLALPLIVARLYGAETFGAFSQVLALHFILAQVAVGGFVFSTLSHVGLNAEDAGAVRAIVTAALILAAGLGLIVSVGVWGCGPAIGRLLESPLVGEGLRWISLGLGCFALNKVLLFALNGLNRMRAYAMGQAARGVLMLAALAVLALAEAPGGMLPAALSLGEAMLLIGLTIYWWPRFPPAPWRTLRAWFPRHLVFGARAFFSGLLLDVNSRVDVVMLGYFTGDRVVGLYSFAALWTEGAYQIVVVIQTLLNPVLSRLRAAGLGREIRALRSRTTRRLLPAMAALTALSLGIYPAVASGLTGDPTFVEGRLWFLTLMAGLTVASGHLAFGFFLNQWGFPGWFAGYVALAALTNVALNAILIPLWEAQGAATATALTFILSAVYLRVLALRVAGVRI